MPKTSFFAFDNAIQAIGETLAAWQRHRDWDDDRIGVVLHISGHTWHRRKKTPKNLTIEEIWRAMNALKIPHEEAVAVLTAGLDSGRR